MDGLIERLEIVVDLNLSSYTSEQRAVDRDLENDVGTEFPFHMCRKRTDLGTLSIDQWWMDKRGLYGERNKTSPNRDAVVNCFWAMCLLDGSALHDTTVQQSYILATLLPHARSNGSRRVFVDASMIRKEDEDARREDIETLDAMLRSARFDQRDVLAFYRTTGNVLGPPEYEAEVENCYYEFVAEIMDDTCETFSRQGVNGLEHALHKWADKMRTIGRRTGHEVEKQVLDVLSYECRAALHRCYSAAWLLLLERLAIDHDMSDESILFHRLWHLDQVLPSNETVDSNVHLFHGHVFGLHPASSDFISTEIGRELLGELISAPADQSCHLRFLNGMLIAIFDYAARNKIANELRRKKPKEFPDGCIETVEGQQTRIKQGRLRPRPLRDDDQ